MDNKIHIILNLFEYKEIRSIWDNEKEVSEVTTICSQLKMLALDVDIFRFIESIPSSKVNL